ALWCRRPYHIVSLSLHDALPISFATQGGGPGARQQRRVLDVTLRDPGARLVSQRDLCRRPGRGRVRTDPAAGERIGLVVVRVERSEAHTSELQSPCNLVCRLPLE